MLTITRRLKADIGHRLLGHEGKCSNFHGHEYHFAITVKADKLDDVGRVIDFSVIKDVVGSWIDTHWDHGFLLHPDDHASEFMLGEGSKVYVMSANPTAENIAMELYNVSVSLLAKYGIKVYSVEVQETVNSIALYTRE